MTITYVEALTGLFEKSILGRKVRIFDPNGSTISRMEQSFAFIAEWASEMSSDDVDSRQFLLWQVSD